MRNVLLDLGRQPLANYLCENEEDSFNAELYQLKAEYNKNLRINLDKEVDPNLLYNEYNHIYRTSILRWKFYILLLFILLRNNPAMFCFSSLLSLNSITDVLL